MFPTFTLHVTILVAVVALNVLLFGTIRCWSRRLLLRWLLKLAFILLKGFRSKGLLSGGGTGAATKLLFPLILLKQQGAEISEL